MLVRNTKANENKAPSVPTAGEDAVTYVNHLLYSVVLMYETRNVTALDANKTMIRS